MRPRHDAFLIFDYCHVLKNVRSQFISGDLGKSGEIYSCDLKKLHEMQKESLEKPVRNLSRKHVFPNNMKKMNVKLAVEVLSPDVTSALEFLRQQAGHSRHASFAKAGSAILLMQIYIDGSFSMIHTISSNEFNKSARMLDTMMTQMTHGLNG